MWLCSEHLVVDTSSIPTVKYQNLLFGEYSSQPLGWRGWSPVLHSWWDNGGKKWDLWLYLASKYTPICFTVFGTRRFGGLFMGKLGRPGFNMPDTWHGSWQTNRFLGSKFPWCPGCASAAVWWHGDPICLKINQQHHLPSQFLCLVTRAPITDSGGKSGSYCLCELVLLLNKYFPSWSGLAQLLPYFRLKL